MCRSSLPVGLSRPTLKTLLQNRDVGCPYCGLHPSNPAPLDGDVPHGVEDRAIGDRPREQQEHAFIHRAALLLRWVQAHAPGEVRSHRDNRTGKLAEWQTERGEYPRRRVWRHREIHRHQPPLRGVCNLKGTSGSLRPSPSHRETLTFQNPIG